MHAVVRELQVMERFAWMTPERWAETSPARRAVLMAYAALREAQGQ